ncbi:MAG TPA: response regulator transcription factor [Candidatus Kapabacteria bacterium]|jgi:DNA-binding NarL/FixJ family response regulator|nr:response regulator transcription factor [Candidatus Kapabacteria bacterium]
MITILIVDDHAIFVRALSSLLGVTGSIRIAGTATNGIEALRLVEDNPGSDVLVLDVSMPEMDGVEVVTELRRRKQMIPVLMLSQEYTGATIARAMKAGAAGYVLKTAEHDELVAAIDAVASGQQFLSSEAQTALIAVMTGRQSDLNPPRLTRRELEILKLVASGQTTNQIAATLFISPLTVETHRHNLMTKLGVKNLAGLVRWAMERGMLDS